MDRDLAEEVAKLRYHVKLIADALQLDSHAQLAIELDWDAADVDKAHDIFEKYDSELEESGTINAHEIDSELQAAFDIHYQEVKSIVRTFWANNQWGGVCLEIAKQQRCTEYHDILAKHSD